MNSGKAFRHFPEQKQTVILKPNDMKTNDQLIAERQQVISKIDRWEDICMAVTVSLFLVSIFTLVSTIFFSLGEKAEILLSVDAIVCVFSFALVFIYPDFFEKKRKRYIKDYDQRPEVRYYDFLREAESFRRIGAARQRNGWDEADKKYYDRMAAHYEEKARLLAEKFNLLTQN